MLVIAFLFKVCSTGSTENLCCVVGGQRCCDEKTFNEDQSKILKMIMQAEQKANGHEDVSTVSESSKSAHKLKRTLIICAACVFGIPFLICILDCLINISAKFRGQVLDFICGPKHHEVHFSDPDGEIVEDEKGQQGFSRNRNISESVVSERNEIPLDVGATGTGISQGVDRRDNDHLDLLPETSAQEQENRVQTLTKLEVELIKAQCAKIFQNEKLEKLKFEMNHSNSAHNLPHKYGRFVVDYNRVCTSARTSPILQPKVRKKTSLVTSHNMGSFLTNDNPVEVMTLGNRSINNSQFSKRSGNGNFSTLPHNSSLDHVVAVEPLFEGAVTMSRKTESPVGSVTSPLFKLEPKKSNLVWEHTKKELGTQNSIESAPTSEDENLTQTTVWSFWQNLRFHFSNLLKTDLYYRFHGKTNAKYSVKKYSSTIFKLPFNELFFSLAEFYCSKW